MGFFAGGTQAANVAGLDVGMHDLPIVGGFFSNPDEQFMQDQMQRSAQAYGMYRPFQAQASMNAMANSASMMRPANTALGAMYGKDAQIDMDQAMRNPMNPDMFRVGQPKANAGR